MRIAILRGESLNPWEMQNFEPLAARLDLTACASESCRYPVDALKIPVKQFPLRSASFDRWGRVARLAARLHLVRRPSAELVGLEEFLKPFDIAHSAETHLPITWQAARAKRQSKLKLVLTCWETIPHAYEDDPAVRAGRDFARREVDLFLPTSQRAARALELEGVDPARVQVLMPGVDLTRFTPGSRPANLPAEHGIGEDDIVTLFVGRLILEKGVRELIVAFASVLRSLPSQLSSRCILLIAGEGPLNAFITALAAHHGIEGRVRIIGGMEYGRLHELHRLADLFVLPSVPSPSWEEQFGMVLIEAMACGKPVISTISGAIPEVVGDVGILVPAMDAAALADAMGRLLSDADLRRDLGRRARARAEACFDASEFARRLEAIYLKLIEGAPQ